ncbi:MAG TPA: hypothetical protein VKR53_16590 [Puia sp.]|nr:hypothetical protein [Puia sp.]
MNNSKNSVVFFINEFVTRIPGYKIDRVLAIMKSKKLNVSAYYFNSDYYTIKKVLNESSTKHIQTILIWDFSQLKISFEKRLFILKLALQKNISIIEIWTEMELKDKDGKIDYDCLIRLLFTPTDGHKVISIVRRFLTNAA